ncbi:hypothetical protein BC828DRAFT_438051 [Blastocladiella britannica]|nr:hypothetical protein BC828DRAFT_438051 [Blastocladiella britannica]
MHQLTPNVYQSAVDALYFKHWLCPSAATFGNKLILTALLPQVLALVYGERTPAGSYSPHETALISDFIAHHTKAMKDRLKYRADCLGSRPTEDAAVALYGHVAPTRAQIVHCAILRYAYPEPPTALGQDHILRIVAKGGVSIVANYWIRVELCCTHIRKLSHVAANVQDRIIAWSVATFAPGMTSGFHDLPWDSLSLPMEPTPPPAGAPARSQGPPSSLLLGTQGSRPFEYLSPASVAAVTAGSGLSVAPPPRPSNPLAAPTGVADPPARPPPMSPAVGPVRAPLRPMGTSRAAAPGPVGSAMLPPPLPPTTSLAHPGRVPPPPPPASVAISTHRTLGMILMPHRPPGQ